MVPPEHPVSKIPVPGVELQPQLPILSNITATALLANLEGMYLGSRTAGFSCCKFSFYNRPTQFP